jgi:CheY-like chemotaxis protein
MPASPPRALLVSYRDDHSPGVRATLASAGLEVETATEPQILAAPTLVPPAVIVLDDPRPRPERRSSQLRLRSHPALSGVPLLVLSEDCSIDSFGGAIARGAAAFLHLPADPAELEETAQRLAAWRRRRPATEGRRAGRRPLLLSADLDVPGRGIVRGRIVDVSATGCRLEAPHAIAPGTTLGIVPRSCEDSTDIRLGGRVRWSRPSRAGSTVAVRWTGTASVVARRLFMGAA